MPNVAGSSAPMHPIWRPGFCAPRSRIDECARSGARRRTTIWGTWPPNLSPPLGIAHLDQHRAPRVLGLRVAEDVHAGRQTRPEGALQGGLDILRPLDQLAVPAERLDDPVVAGAGRQVREEGGAEHA